MEWFNSIVQTIKWVAFLFINMKSSPSVFQREINDDQRESGSDEDRLLESRTKHRFFKLHIHIMTSFKKNKS